MNIKKTLAIISAAAMMLTCAAMPVSAQEQQFDPISRKPFTVPDTEGKTKLYESDGRVFVMETGKSAPFTGKSKNSKGTRYFINGSLYFGWQKINGKWYYFDPENKGYMATGTAKTAAGRYSLDADGSWNGKMASGTRAPKGFFVSCTEKNSETGDFFEVYIASEVEKRHSHVTALSKEPQFEGNADLAIPAKDRQMIYDMLLSCKLGDITDALDSTTLDGYDLANDADTFEVRFCISEDGKEQTVSGSNKLYGHYDDNTDVQHTAYFIAFMDNYINSCKEMIKISEDFAKVADEAEAKEAEKLAQLNAEVKKTLKNTESRIYATSGKGLEQKVLLKSEEEAWDFTQDILAPAYGKDKKFISYLVNYEQSFFEDHVIYVEIYNSDTSARQFRFERAEKVAAGDNDDIRVVYTSDVPEGGKQENVDFILITILERDEAGKFNNIYNYYIEG